MNLLRSVLAPLGALAVVVGPAFTKPKTETLDVSLLGTHSAGHFDPDATAAEIAAHDPKTQRLFVVNGAFAKIDVLSIRNPSAPAFLFDIDCTPFGSQPNSVAVHDGVVAVAVQAAVKTDPGKAVFFDARGKFLAAVTVGALPDMICFTPDGDYVLVANEGEPSDDYAVDPEGSVSVIKLPKHIKLLQQSDVRTADFSAFNGTALDDSIRIFGANNPTVAQDLEPEYIAVSKDSRKAYVTLQENNAIAIVDIKSAKVVALHGLGFKDHAAIDAVTEIFEFDPTTLPSIGTTLGGQTLHLGGFSGLAFEGIDPVSGNYKFITNTDRGPNGEPTGQLRPFLLPEFTPEVVRFELDRDSGALTITQRIPLLDFGGTPLTGLPNSAVAGGNGNTPHNDEIGVDLLGNVLANDPLGGDFEGIVIDPNDGTMWLCDEYRPAIYQFSPTGVLLNRYVPIGAGAAAGVAPGTLGEEVLPSVLAQRRQNRGFEAIAWDNGRIYAWVQSPARNPVGLANSALNAMQNVRVVELNPVTKIVRQFLYVMDNPAPVGADDTRADKIGDAIGLGGGEFLVVERDDDSVTSLPADPLATIQKKVYRISLAGASELTAAREAAFFAATGKTPDQATLAELTSPALPSSALINPLGKVLHVDLATAGYNTVQKVEGIAVVDPWTIAVINDNDFQVAGIAIDNTNGTFTLLPDYTPELITLGLIDVKHQGLDASDRDDPGNNDGRINIRPWPVFGMYLPDGIATFKTRGEEFLITANEGDAREYIFEDDAGEEVEAFVEEARVSSLTLDPTAFPFGNTLKHADQLGRLTVTTTLGKKPGTEVFEKLYVFGARSFTIWNRKGELVFDSGDTIEQLIAADPDFAAIFNASNDDNSLDNRSDNKGPEPESVIVAELGHSLYAFVGLERIGGFMIFDISDPTAPAFIDYINNRNPDPDAEPALDDGSDYGPEGLLFIDAKDSPIRCPLLVVANEVSGTTTIYKLDVDHHHHRGWKKHRGWWSWWKAKCGFGRR